MDRRALDAAGDRGEKRLEQPLPFARRVRPRKDKAGQLPNGKVQTDRKGSSRREDYARQAAAIREKFYMEASPYEWRPEDGEAGKVYYFRCAALGVHEWERTTGPGSIHAAVKMKLWRMDHDAAFKLAFGRVPLEVEVRYEGSAQTMKFRCDGMMVPRYLVERVD